MSTVVPVKDRQTVTPDGQSLKPLIHDVVLHRMPLQEDERGELCEIYNPAWGLLAAPLVYVYQSLIRPGKIKGWVMHRSQEDRIFISSGITRWALFDNRPESPTYRMLNDIVLSDRQHSLLIIPRGVFHAVQNIGSTDAIFVNMPTVPYNHADPDKYRLPLANELIPFSFADDGGW
ncbi:MAG: dTDP-4-dehydrorhamnose 3,5-epimerase family protein [Chloroflexaceae bacterium]|jgi:dTDP-4-dehydrorhamnose 3,5-epimerase|nr:dTDP-4-dehydrorhamnose 3,5-epimerase family protein [Chloroflexaceae bacterium]